MRETKIDALRKAAAAGDWRTALRIAARFPRLGAHKAAITRAWTAYQYPAFYRQLGQSSDAKGDPKRAAAACEDFDLQPATP